MTAIRPCRYPADTGDLNQGWRHAPSSHAIPACKTVPCRPVCAAPPQSMTTSDTRTEAMITAAVIGSKALAILGSHHRERRSAVYARQFSPQLRRELTFYITAVVIITPRSSGSPTRQRLLVCIIVFTIASMLCRAAQSLPRIVAVRPPQGSFDAGPGAAVAGGAAAAVLNRQASVIAHMTDNVPLIATKLPEVPLLSPIHRPHPGTKRSRQSPASRRALARQTSQLGPEDGLWHAGPLSVIGTNLGMR